MSTWYAYRRTPPGSALEQETNESMSLLARTVSPALIWMAMRAPSFISAMASIPLSVSSPPSSSSSLTLPGNLLVNSSQEYTALMSPRIGGSSPRPPANSPSGVPSGTRLSHSTATGSKRFPRHPASPLASSVRQSRTSSKHAARAPAGGPAPKGSGPAPAAAVIATAGPAGAV